MKFSITNLEDFSNVFRHEAAKSICSSYTENLDDYITIDQIKQLVTKNSIGKDDDGCYIVTENIIDDTFDEIRNRIYQVGLARLASSGAIECAWDNDKNEMIFWMDSKTKGFIDISSHPQYTDSNNE